MCIGKLQITGILGVLLLAISSACNAQVFDVTKYGAKADGKSFINEALISAWKLACASAYPSKVVIPRGTFLLGEVKLEGPCKAPVKLQVQGTVKAPADPSQFKTDGWVTVQYINSFTLFGGGVFDGQGKVAWTQNDCHTNGNCRMSPINLRFDFVTNGLVQDITTLDSKNFHANVLGDMVLHPRSSRRPIDGKIPINRFTATAPKDSPNTDGIHIGRSDGIYITDSNIGTGDDCISLGDGSRQIHVTGVNCGPGHGITVGSLGKYPNEEPVSGVWVKNCTLTNTDNGVRIKTWPASYPGTVSDLHFEHIFINKVSNPILIDQVYCPWNHCHINIPSLVQISNVYFSNIWGSSSTAVAVKLACSSKLPCNNVELDNIDLRFTGPNALAAVSQTSNVMPICQGKQIPLVCHAH